ncbi:MAG: hypothetical protein KDB31_00360, partial [Microthrixaceae bacterium]|nr:hypothetical protein [Microthrixaceae bacterium]
VSTDRIAFRSGVLFVDGGQTGGVIERVLLGEGGVHPCGDVQPGDIVTVHWDWVCEVVDSATSRCLAAAELAALGSANRALASAGTVDLGG